ncbi:hypothetical protein M422DRAFT_244605 [Sphaerobolus stellatus SS14]|nr:hypothetical protein M422DRAFT_244605 [Sphaerobolus stellatus SS14]
MGSTRTRAEFYVGEFNFPGIKAEVQEQSEGTADIREIPRYKWKARIFESFPPPAKIAQKLGTLLAPAKDVVLLLDAVAEIHPALKVFPFYEILSVVLRRRGVIQLELDRHENDKQIAVVFFTMSSLLFRLSKLDPIFANESAALHSSLDDHLKDMCASIKDFGNFCDIYPRQKSSLFKTLRPGKYKEKLENYAKDFTVQEKKLDLLLMSHTGFARLQSIKEKKNKQEIGGADHVMQDDKLVDKLVEILNLKKDKVNSATCRAVKTDLGDLLKANENVYEMKLERSLATLNMVITDSRDAIIAKGPHAFIGDSDIQNVWKEMRANTSTKVWVFLDTVYHYFNWKFAKEENPHPDKWTLKFLSKVIFYSSIGDAIDDDCSGFVSVHEVNQFLKSRPDRWSVPEWIAFWATGPYLNNIDYQEKIEALKTKLNEAIDVDGDSDPKNYVLNVNRKHVRYFVNGITTRLNLIDIFEDLSDFYGGSMTDTKIEKLHVQWREIQEAPIIKNLENSRYQLPGEDHVSLILGTSIIEQFGTAESDSDEDEDTSTDWDSDEDKKKLDPKELLLHPIPEEPEDDKYLETEVDSDWESPEEKRKKYHGNKLTSIESLLRKLLTVQGINMDEDSAHQAQRISDPPNLQRNIMMENFPTDNWNKPPSDSGETGSYVQGDQARERSNAQEDTGNSDNESYNPGNGENISNSDNQSNSRENQNDDSQGDDDDDDNEHGDDNEDEDENDDDDDDEDQDDDYGDNDNDNGDDDEDDDSGDDYEYD